MAQVLPASVDRAVFASVFSNPAKRRPAEKSRAPASSEPDILSLKRTLRPHLRHLLGIRLDRDLSNSSPPATEADHYCDLPSLNQDCIVLLQRQWAQSPVWQLISSGSQQFDHVSIKRLLADILDELLPEYILSTYALTYRPEVREHLKLWVDHVYAGLISFSVSTLDSNPRLPDDDDVLRWEFRALTELGALRVKELYYIITHLGTTSSGIEDLRHFATSPATRTYLTNQFSEYLSKHLLQPGAATIEILRTYILVIQAFRQLDPRGVLLDRIARPIRRYLRERDNAIRVIVNGLLSDPSQSADTTNYDPDNLSELATELIRQAENSSVLDDGELDWDNMEWMPDPIDAAPDYSRSKNTDVVGSLTSLFESKDVFMKELQTALAERLLQNKPHFDLERRVVEHLKSRFGDAALQPCEVMLRDILESGKIDDVIKKDQASQPRRRRTGPEPELHAKILSRLFWTALPEQEFELPVPLRKQQQKYEQGFEALKNARKLTWLPSAGQVEVELQFEDRTFAEEVLPYQATVIYAFTDAAAAHPVAQLAEALSMSLILARSACIFWVSKRVLVETETDTFAVLETLPTGAEGAALAENATLQDSSAVAAAEAAAAQAAKEAEEEERKQKMAIYHQFIVSMLTNAGAMPLPRISMMLGMVVPGGFPFSNEELKEFMSSMVKEGVLEVGPGGNWKVAS